MSSNDEINGSIDHLFRHHAGQMVAVLSRIFGFEKLDLIEDAVQDSLISALKDWPYSGMPANPKAWLTAVAKNRVIDRLRKDGKLSSIEEEGEINVPGTINLNDNLYFEKEISEDQLRMILACCHPAIPPDSQVALTLKIVGGFGISEIARAFLATDDSVAKMISRSKLKLREHQVKLDFPVPAEIPDRLDAALKALYLIFNEGYGASGGDELIRQDLCFEAIRLCEILAVHPVTASPRVHALEALFFFQGARLSARCDHHGEMLILADQDRSLWNGEMLSRGLRHFKLSASGTELSDYHLEAEIAALHVFAKSYESTDWQRILECYETLQKRKFSPVVELNKIVVLGQIDGPGRALEELDKLSGASGLGHYNLFHITRAYLLAETGHVPEARYAFERAIDLTNNQPLRRFLVKKMEELNGDAMEPKS